LCVYFTVVTFDILYFMLVHVYNHEQMQSGSNSWSRHNLGAAAEVDVIMNQQLKRVKLLIAGLVIGFKRTNSSHASFKLLMLDRVHSVDTYTIHKHFYRQHLGLSIHCFCNANDLMQTPQGSAQALSIFLAMDCAKASKDTHPPYHTYQTTPGLRTPSKRGCPEVDDRWFLLILNSSCKPANARALVGSIAG